MAHRFQGRHHKAHKVGGYEELSLITKTDGFREGYPGPFMKRFTQLHERCHGLVGVKQTRFATWGREHWEILRPGLIVRTHRPIRPTIQSLIKHRGDGDWRKFIWEREKNMNEVFGASDFPYPVVDIDFGEERTEEWAANWLRPHVEGLRSAKCPTASGAKEPASPGQVRDGSAGGV